MTKYTTAADGPSPTTIDGTTVLSLLAALSLLIAAYGISNVALSKSTGVKLRLIFIWHLFDALVHFIFEGSFLYHCFFTHVPGANLNGFLGEPGRLYGAAYGTSPTARLWQEYAKADARWGGADLTVISIELLTVFVAGPLAAYICDCIRRESFTMWFWVIVLATGEIYGGKWPID
ncbi:MAG: hypothetical protein M1825_004299 [Sarcosagium campestre]|nr:MAG: hypothetical protein M1825_004299 [Sarcosagium campestre]